MTPADLMEQDDLFMDHLSRLLGEVIDTRGLSAHTRTSIPRNERKATTVVRIFRPDDDEHRFEHTLELDYDDSLDDDTAAWVKARVVVQRFRSWAEARGL